MWQVAGVVVEKFSIEIVKDFMFDVALNGNCNSIDGFIHFVRLKQCVPVNVQYIR